MQYSIINDGLEDYIQIDYDIFLDKFAIDEAIDLVSEDNPIFLELPSMYQQKLLLRKTNDRDLIIFLNHLDESGCLIKTDGNDVFNMVQKAIDEYRQYKEKMQLDFDNTYENSNEDIPINKSSWRDGFTPYNFQLEATTFALKNKSTMDFSSPGAGKTIISYMIASSLFSDGLINTIVVFGPKSAREAWFSEWNVVMDEGYINARSSELFDFTKSSKYIQSIGKGDFRNDKLNIVFINYHKLDNITNVEHITKILKGQKYATFFDEAHYIKTVESLRHKRALKISENSFKNTILTGTPVPRKIYETWFSISLLFPGIDHRELSAEDFKSMDKQPHKLKENFSKFFSRYNKQKLVDSGELAGMTIDNVLIPMGPIEQYLMDQLETLGYLENKLDTHTIRKMNKALLIRRMQAASNPQLLQIPLEDSIASMKEEMYDALDDPESNYFGESDKKLEDEIEKIIQSSAMKKIIEEQSSKVSERQKMVLDIISKNDERLIVWEVFRASMNNHKTEINKSFPNRKAFIINGNITGEDRQRTIRDFKKSTNGILIASPATIAESISLHEHVDKAIYAFRNYVGSHWMQSQDRIHRLVKPGQETKEKNIYVIISDGESIDKLIDKNLKEKVVQQSILLD